MGQLDKKKVNAGWFLTSKNWEKMISLSMYGLSNYDTSCIHVLKKLNYRNGFILKLSNCSDNFLLFFVIQYKAITFQNSTSAKTKSKCH